MIQIKKFMDKLIIAILYTSVLLFILYPFLCVFYEALIVEGQFGFDLFRDFFQNDTYLFKNSIKVAILTTILSTIVSVSIGIYCFIAGKRVTRWITLVMMLTMISPPFVTSLSYINLFGRRGFITHDLLGLTLNTYGMTGIILMQSLGFISLNALVIIGSLSRMNTSIIQSARDLGAKTTSAILDIILPMLKPTVLVVALLTFVRSLADFSTPIIIGGNFNTMATEAYLNMIAYGNIDRASVINVILFIPSMLAFFIYRKNMAFASASLTEENQESLLSSRGVLYFVVKVISLVFVFLLLMQYASIFAVAFTKKQMGVSYFTLQNFVDSKFYISGTFIRSIVYSFIAGVLGAIFGLLIGYYLEIRKLRFMPFIDFIATMPYIIPGSFFGIGYILAFRGAPFYLTGTAAIVVLNVLFKQLPFASKVGAEGANRISLDTVNSAKDLGGRDLDVLKDVIFPLSKNNLFIAFANSFTATMTTIGSIIFLVHPGQKLATLVMFEVIQSGKYNVGSVIAVLIILITMSANLLLYKVLIKETRARNTTSSKENQYVS